MFENNLCTYCPFYTFQLLSSFFSSCSKYKIQSICTIFFISNDKMLCKVFKNMIIIVQILCMVENIGSEWGSDGVLCTGEACSEYRCDCPHVPRHSSPRAKQVGSTLLNFSNSILNLNISHWRQDMYVHLVLLDTEALVLNVS